MRRWVPVAIGAGIVVWVVALALLAVTTRDTQGFVKLQPWILMVNAAGVLILLAVLAGRFIELLRDRRRHVPGSQLRTQSVLMLSGLVLAPLLLVFTFSVLFLTRGIDSWFHVEVRQGLTDALGLSRAALDLRMREYLARTERIERTSSSRGPRGCSTRWTSIAASPTRSRSRWSPPAARSRPTRPPACSTACRPRRPTRRCCRRGAASPTSASTLSSGAAT
jgi:hypothetical protein